ERLNLEEGKSEKAVQQTLFGDVEMVQPATTQKETIETIPHQYYLVENEMQRASLRAELSVADAFCFDTETTGLDTHSAEIVCMSFAFRKHEAYCVLVPSKKEEAQKVISEFREVFADENILKIGQNLKYDLLMLGNYGIEVKGKMFDTMLAHYLIQPEQKHNLDYLCEIYLNYEKVHTESLIGKKGKYYMKSAVTKIPYGPVNGNPLQVPTQERSKDPVSEFGGADFGIMVKPINGRTPCRQGVVVDIIKPAFVCKRFKPGV
ncbi:MAG: hypothetical protein PHV51_08870, partial [Methanosarcinaceae archaeon]|nr:hypothetical protein [Methanosarcinaceae archaeon]